MEQNRQITKNSCPETKNIFAPPPTKTAEFEEKSRHKSAEKAKPKYLLCVTYVCLFCLLCSIFILLSRKSVGGAIF